MKAHSIEHTQKKRSPLKQLFCLLILMGMSYQISAAIMDRVSISDSGTVGNNNSIQSSISSDGRYVAFASEASNLVSSDTNGVSDIFVYDRKTNVIERVSKTNSGVQGDGKSWYPKISADGNYVVFTSLSTNFTSKATNNKYNVYMYDRAKETIKCISCASDGTPGDLDSYTPDVSKDGAHVVFTSLASNIVAGDTNGFNDVYLYTVATDTLKRIKTNAGAELNETSYNCVISSDGKFIAFDSFASNIVDNDTNSKYDVFVYDIAGATSTRVSVKADGTEGNNNSWRAAISSDGSVVAFASDASNLVDSDNNGKTDVFVYKKSDSSLTLISKADDGTLGDNNSGSDSPGISDDGRYVTFESLADNLVSSSGQGSENVFLYDRTTEKIKIINFTHDGSSMAATLSRRPSISGDGSFVAFDSNCSKIASTKFNGNYDVYVNAWNNALLTMDATPDGSGTTDPAVGSHSVGMGQAISISAKAAAGYIFSSWSTTANGVIADSDSSSTTVTISGDTTVTATFVQTVALTMVVDPIAWGSTTPDVGTHNVAKGIAQTITAVAEAGYNFVGWEASNDSAVIADTSAASTTVTLSGDSTVTAKYSSPTQSATLTMAIQPASSGSTTPTVGEHSVVINAEQAITATPASGYFFTGWTVSGSATIADASAASTTTTLTGNATVTALFSAESPTKVVLTMAVDPAASGTTTPTAGDSRSVIAGVEQAITATAATGYNFVGWTVSAGSATFANASSATTTVNLSEDSTITALFSKVSVQTCNLTMAVSPALGGTTSPTAGTSKINTGLAQKISATAATGYTFVGWAASGNVELADATAASTIATPSGDATITALFSLDSAGSKKDITVLKLDIKAKGDGKEKDAVGLTLSLPEGFAFTPADESFKIIIGQWEFEIEKGNTWSKKGKLTYSGTLDIGKVKILIDTEKKNQLIMKTTNTIIGDKINTSGGVNVYLVIGDLYYAGSCTPCEKSSWKASAASTFAEGFTANASKLTGKYTNSTVETKQQYTFVLTGDSFEDPTGGFSSDIVPVISLDQAEWDFTEAEVKNKKDSYTYKLKEANLTLQFKVDTKKGKWSFKVVGKSSDKASNVSKSGSVRVIITLKKTATSEEWNSVNTIPATIKRTVKFKQ